MYPFRTLMESPATGNAPSSDRQEAGRSPSESFAARLASFDRATVDRLFARLTEEITEVLVGEYCVEGCQREITELLRSGLFTEHIRDEADLERCLEGMVALLSSHVEKTETGVRGDFHAVGGLKKDVANVFKLIRGDFYRDFAVCLDMVRANPLPDQWQTILDAVVGVSDLIQTGEDLRRIHAYVETVARHGQDAGPRITSLFGDAGASETVYDRTAARTVPNPERTRIQGWSADISDSATLDTVLSVAELGAVRGVGVEGFLNGVGHDLTLNASPEELEELKGVTGQLIDDTIAGLKGEQYHANDAVRQAFESLNRPQLAQRIRSAEDVRHYGRLVLKVFSSLMRTSASTGRADAYHASAELTNTVDRMLGFLRDDPERDLETLAAIAVEQPSSGARIDILPALGAIRGLIRTSADIQHVAKFLHAFSERGMDGVSELFCGSMRNGSVVAPALFGVQLEMSPRRSSSYVSAEERRLDDISKKWQEALPTSEAFGRALSVMQAAIFCGDEVESLIAGLYDKTPGEIASFVDKAPMFSEKGIPPQFVAQHMRELSRMDLKKEGMAMFTTANAKRDWLNYCAHLWKVNPIIAEASAHFFDEALASVRETVSKQGHDLERIKGLDRLAMLEAQEDVDDAFRTTTTTLGPDLEQRTMAKQALEKTIYDLLQMDNFEAVDGLCKRIKGAAEFVAEVDRTHAATIRDGEVRAFLADTRARNESRGQRGIPDEQVVAHYPYFKNPLAKHYFPAMVARLAQGYYASSLLAVSESMFGPSANSALANVERFNALAGILPESRAIQPKYHELLDVYVKTYIRDDFGGGQEDRGDAYRFELEKLVRLTGVPIAVSEKEIQELYAFCVSEGRDREGRPFQDDRFHAKIGDIARLSNVLPDASFMRAHIWDDASFDTPISLPVSDADLDGHFAKAENRTVAEYRRIYRIFGCHEYYQRLLERLEAEGGARAKRDIIGVLGAMGAREIDSAERYEHIKQRLLGFVGEKGAPVSDALAQALAELAKSGDAELLSYLASALRERAKASGIVEGRSALGLNPLQKAALRALGYVDNPVANEQLLALSFTEGLDRRLRLFIVGHLVKDKPDFFPKRILAWLRRSLRAEPGDDAAVQAIFADLEYFYATAKIPNADLRKKVTRHTERAFDELVENDLSPSDIQARVAKSVPKEAFLPAWTFASGNEVLLGKLNGLYGRTKSSTDREGLLLGMVQALTTEKSTLKAVTDRLGEIDLAHVTAEDLGSVLKAVGFLDEVERILGQREGQARAILSDKKIDTVEALSVALKGMTIQKVKELLPHEGITSEKIQTLAREWGTLEPIFVYAGKMSSYYRETLGLVAEMVAHMDPPTYEGWKTWRYRTTEASVSAQIGHLDEKQLAVWKQGHFSELGDVMIALTPSDKPRKIASFIEGSVRDGHIHPPSAMMDGRHALIQNRLAPLVAAIGEQPDTRVEAIAAEIVSAERELADIDAVIRYGELLRLDQAIALFAEKDQLPVNAKTKNVLTYIEQYLDKETYGSLEQAYKQAEKDDRPSIETIDLGASGIVSALKGKGLEIRGAFERAAESGVFERNGVERSQAKNLGLFYQKRQQLKAMVDLCRLLSLDTKKIAMNRIVDREDKKGETLAVVIERLKGYFKDVPAFVQDLENVQAVVTQREDLGARRRLAMIVTDDPQMVLQSGKYPLGCGSCQNYEGDSSWNKSLAGYVADAHTQVSYLIDLNKLSAEARELIEARGFEEVKSLLKQQDLLEASIARSIVKQVRNEQDGEGYLFIEPTYSSVNKGDLGMDKFFNLFLELTVADPMGIRLVRGGGDKTVRVPKSRNLNGQYEDCAAGNAGHAGMGIQLDSYTMSARLVDRFSPVTDEDKRLAARISS